MSALDEVLAHYEDAISNWHDPLRPRAVARKDVLDGAREELAELRRTISSSDEFAINQQMWYNYNTEEDDMRLKLALARCGSVVLGTVLEQEGFERGEFYRTYDGFDIASDDHPELFDGALDIRGSDRSMDLWPFFFDYETEEAAIIDYAKIIDAVNTINAGQDERDAGGIQIIGG